MEAAEHLTLEEAKLIIHASIDGKQTDPNFDQSLLRRAQAALSQEALSPQVCFLSFTLYSICLILSFSDLGCASIGRRVET